MAAMSSTISSIVMGILFILPGIIKTIRLNATLHKEMLRTYKNLTEVSPLRYFGITPNPRTYMQTMGVLELVFGTTLIVGTKMSKKMACLGLMFLMLATACTQLILRDFTGMVVPCGYFALLSWVYISMSKQRAWAKEKPE